MITNFHKVELYSKKTTIYGAEQEGLSMALDHIRYQHVDHTDQKFVILTDSKSTVDALKGVKKGTQIPHNLIPIIGKLNDFLRQDREIIIQWIPSHVEGIQGNYLADRAAFHAAESSTIDPLARTTYLDLQPTLQEKIKKDWSTEYDRLTLESGTWTKSILQNPLSRPWFHNKTFQPRITTSINRLILGHGCTQKFKYLMKKINDYKCQFCLPSEYENDLYHIFDCCKYKKLNKPIYKATQFSKRIFKTPFGQP
ncbi:unnamed protein product [Nesidiocoris tenuis]|uniref:RNase H type-1 domain-containing protein n=1 Tax=Nesidiocoris tenuis TaxID=355587 RepID=A0A6H5HBC6_9HEMI|nr:unnamed protein product [Nesidiocoris tenuis]